VKSFLRGEVQAGKYGPTVTNKWLPGHNPEVVFYDSTNTEMERKDLSSMKFASIQALMTEKGFRKVGEIVDSPKMHEASSSPKQDDVFDRDEFLDPEPRPAASTSSSSRIVNDIHLPGFVSTSGVSRPLSRMMRGQQSVKLDSSHEI